MLPRDSTAERGAAGVGFYEKIFFKIFWHFFIAFKYDII